MADEPEISSLPAVVSCPRCAQSPDERRADHKSKHAVGCSMARGARKIKFQDVAELATADVANLSTTGRESAKRITQQVREGLMTTFEAMGGDRALLEWARSNPSTFFQMWARAVPRESEAQNRGAGITVVVAGASELRERRGRVFEAVAQ